MYRVGTRAACCVAFAAILPVLAGCATTSTTASAPAAAPNDARQATQTQVTTTATTAAPNAGRDADKRVGENAAAPSKPKVRVKPLPVSPRERKRMAKQYVRCFKKAYERHGFGAAMDADYGRCLKRHGLRRRMPTG